MRSVLPIVLLILLSAGAWLLWPRPVVVGPGPTGDQTRTARPGMEAQDLGAETGRESVPVRPASDPVDAASKIPVTLEGQDATTRAPVLGFTYELFRDNVKVAAAAVPEGRALLRLGPGRYRLGARHDDYQSPGATEFTVRSDSEPFTVNLSFTPIESLLHLEVLDQSTQLRLDAFRLRIDLEQEGHETQTHFVPKPEHNPVPIHAPRGWTLVVHVEAPGYTPADPLRVLFPAGVQKIDKKVYLAKGMAFSGIELRVRSSRDLVVPRVIVHCQRKTSGVTFQSLWRRRKSEQDGVYELPDLQPGTYRLHIHAIDESDLPTTDLDAIEEVTITGNEHVRRDVALAPGACIELSVVDRNDAPAGKGVNVQLMGSTDRKVTETLWRNLPTGRDAETTRGIDVLPVDGRVVLDRCVVPGPYVLRLQRSDGEAVNTDVQLRGGERVKLRIVVPR